MLAFENRAAVTPRWTCPWTARIGNPGTPPVSTYSVGVHLVAGQTYTLQLSGGGESANLSWATPSDLAPGISQAVAAAKSAATAVVVVSDDTETEAADRPSLNLPSAQNELVSAVAAANPHTVVVVDAGAPVAMPWLSQVASVVDAWYPGESNGTALASVLFGQTDPSGHLPVTFPADLSQVPASTPAQFPGVNGKVLYSEGIDVGYRYYDAHHETPDVPVRLRAVLHQLQVQRPAGHAAAGPQYVRPRPDQLRVQRPGAPAGDGLRDHHQHRPGDRVRCRPALPERSLVRHGAPRQLKGFQKVTLRPGQSATVRFSLTGHDLSYWNSAANGWVVPGGQFGVYLGDSSALAGLPLRGGFTVTR